MYCLVITRTALDSCSVKVASNDLYAPGKGGGSRLNVTDSFNACFTLCVGGRSEESIGRLHRSLETCLVGTEPGVHNQNPLGFWWAEIHCLD